jgi:dipeptidyl aminopeptidase/acylaminoacyl peptidase
MSTRSPLLHAHGVRTPTMFVAGELDDCTPPGQAVEMFRALSRRGVPAELVRYPEEGHGIVHRAARQDHWARVLDWLRAHV